jgi:hypothetical protein
VAYSGLIGVIERCPKEPSDRLTVYRATAKAADTPSVLFSIETGARQTRIVTMNALYVAVAMPGPNRLVVFNSQTGKQLNQYPINLAPRDLAGDPAGRVVPVATGPSATYWWTGSSTIALSTTNLAPEWTVPNTLGPGVVFAGNYLAPVDNGLLVLNQATGAKIGEIGVNRHGYAGQVMMATLGPVVFEQRGSTLAALH